MGIIAGFSDEADMPDVLTLDRCVFLPSGELTTCVVLGMAPFLFRCPTISLNLQGWITDDPTVPLNDMQPGELAAKSGHYG